jgi:hypothetical protein
MTCKLLLLAALLLLPGIAMASKGVNLSNGDVLILFCVLVLIPVLLLINLVTSLANIGRKRRGVRIYNSIVSGLLGLLIIPLAAEWPGAAIMAAAGLALQVIVIYLSLPKKLIHEQTIS